MLKNIILAGLCAIALQHVARRPKSGSETVTPGSHKWHWCENWLLAPAT